MYAPGKQSRAASRAADGDPDGPDRAPAPGRRSLAQGAETGGSALPAVTLAKFERAFGTSFADVRVHESSEPAALGAGAFARGNKIYIAPGRYAPATLAGDRLLGHELAHVVQQRSGRVSGDGGMVNKDPSLEREADELGERAARGEVVHGGAGGSAPASPPVQAAPIQCIDQRDEAQLPTAVEQNTLRGHLDPGTRNPVHHGAPAIWDGRNDQDEFDERRRELRKEMVTALNGFRIAKDNQLVTKRNARRVAMTQHHDVHGDTGVAGIVAQAQAAITAKLGSWIANGVRSAPATSETLLRAGQELIDGNDRAQRQGALHVSDTIYAGDTAMWAARNHPACKRVLDDHHWSPGANEAMDFLGWVVTTVWMKAGDNQAWIADYHTFCMNEHAHAALILDTTIDEAGHNGDADAAERAKRWALFGTSIHEVMHGCAHPNFVRATNRRTVMKEGFVEYFAAQVAAPLVLAAAGGQAETLRAIVEGSAAADHLTPIAPYHTPTAYAAHVTEVTGMRDLIGEQALCAAFFQGHVEFLGLAPDGQQSTDVNPPKPIVSHLVMTPFRSGTPTLRVPPGMATLDNLAWRSGVNTDMIKGANKGLVLGDDISMHARLKLPGCREHIVVETPDGHAETCSIIARQHGRTTADLQDANPDRVQIDKDNWAPLQAGDRILIPAK